MLVLRPGALGDTLLAVPALRALRHSFQPLTLAANGPAARLLEAVGEIDRGLPFDDPSLQWLVSDRHVSDEPVIAWMSTPLKYATLRAPSRPEGVQHAAHYLLETLAPLGVELTFDDHPLAVEAWASDEILVHPGSGSPSKNWPAKRFASVIRVLGAPVRLILGEADYAAVTAVQAHLQRPLPTLELRSLEELAARLAGCRAYLGNDSGVSHLAGLCGARSVTLFGPTNPDVWRPIGPDVHVLAFNAKVEEVVSALRR